MRCFRYEVVSLICAVVGVTGSVARAQTPSPARLLDEWQSNRANARTRLHSYRVDGEFQSKNLPGLLEAIPLSRRAAATAPKPLYKWIALRDEKRFLWDATDADFEWNPHRAPDINRAALSFDGSQYYRLDLHNQFQQGVRSRTIPQGIKVTPLYHQEHPARLVAPIPPGGRPTPPVMQSPEFIHSTMEEGLRWFQGYPFEPWQVLQDNFNIADNWGNLLAELRKRVTYLSVAPDTIDGVVSMRLDLPFQKARSEKWLPTSVWFRQEQGHWVPWRYYSTDNALVVPGQTPRDDAQGARTVTVTQAQVTEGVWWPSEIKTVFSLYRNGHWIDTSEDTKTLLLSRINQGFALSEFQVDFPKYAAVVDNGKRLPREKLPDLSPLWSLSNGLQAVLNGLIAASVTVILALLWRRIRRQPASA